MQMDCAANLWVHADVVQTGWSDTEVGRGTFSCSDTAVDSVVVVFVC